jgi:hypothetical protein
MDSNSWAISGKQYKRNKQQQQQQIIIIIIIIIINPTKYNISIIHTPRCRSLGRIFGPSPFN